MSEWLDEVARAMAAGQSRRGVLRVLGVAVLGTAFSATRVPEAAADDTPKPLGKKCSKNRQCASGFCSNGVCTDCGGENKTCCPGSRCGSNLTCVNNTCTACGHLGLPCCPGGDCGSAAICQDESGMCDSCCLYLQLCFRDNGCSAGFTCLNDICFPV